MSSPQLRYCRTGADCFGIDFNMQQGRGTAGLCLQEQGFEFLSGFNRTGKQTITSGQRRKIRIVNIGARDPVGR